jgi:hypothetical protein
MEKPAYGVSHVLKRGFSYIFRKSLKVPLRVKPRATQTGAGIVLAEAVPVIPYSIMITVGQGRANS